MADSPHAPTSPPPIRSNRMRVAGVIIASVIMAGLLLVVVFNIDRSTTPPPTPVVLDDVPELILPEPLTDDEIQSGEFDPASTSGLAMDNGGSIEVANLDGSRAQEYRFDRLDPNPDGRPAGWLQMDRPFAVMYSDSGRIFTLSGESALAYRPNLALESGTLTGNVVIRIYDSEPGHRFVPGELEPVGELKTEEAQFDNQLGEILCAGLVDFTSDNLELSGESLRLRFNDEQRIAQLLEIEDVHQVTFRTPAGEDGAADQRVDPDPNADSPNAVADAGVGQSEPTQFYLLTLNTNVQIEQTGPGANRLVTGDDLAVVFSFESEGINDLVAFSPFPSRGVPASPAPVPAFGPMSRETWLASLALASWQDEDSISDEARTTITCEGGLRMVPLPEDAVRPDSPTDAALNLTGSPVTLSDFDTSSHVVCGEFIYTTDNRRLELKRTADQPVTIENPDLLAEVGSFWIDQREATGRFEGAGWLASRTRTEDAREPVAPQDPAPAGAAPSSDPLERLRVTWEGGVNLSFEPTGPDDPLGPLREAVFETAVRVRSDEGSIDCETLQLAFRQGEESETVPDALTATGDARLRANPAPDTQGGGQTIWANLVHVTFSEGAPAEDAPEALDPANPFGGNTQVRTLHAEGDVQVLLDDRSRVFASILDGNAQQEELTLEGDDIVLVSGQIIVERGTKVHLVKSTGKVDWPGSGQARIFATPLEVGADRRIARPAPANDDEANPRQVDARWNDSMRFENEFNDGAGRLVLVGDVVTTSTPSPLEKSTLTSGEQELHFAIADESDAEPPTDEASSFDSSRRLRKLVARGDAKLESRRHYAMAPEIKPQLFYIAGEQIEYDDISFEAKVEGAGELLIRNLLPDGVAAETGAAPFDGLGTTAFKWTERLEMTHIVDDRYEIVMAGSVAGLHVDLDEQSATITAETITADVARASLGSDTEGPTGELQFGTDIDLKRVHASGGVYVRTPTRDVSCHEFDYNLLTNLARAKAAPSGRVAVKNRDQPNPIYARQIVWNLVTDRIEVIGGGGSSFR